MFTATYGGITARDRLEEARKTAYDISHAGYLVTGRWFDFQIDDLDSDIEVLENGKPVGRISDLGEAEDFIDWIAQ